MFGLFSKTFDPTKDLKDLSGKVVIVTGGNSGIGYPTARFLALAGAKVYIGARSEEKGTKAVESLTQEVTQNSKEWKVKPGQVDWFWCDISTPAKAKKSAEGFLEKVKEGKLDVLVNNAANVGSVYGTPENTAEDGITEGSMTNHFGTFVFTQTLLPLLIKTSEEPGSDVRIVSLSSEAHKQGLGSSPLVNFKTLDEFKKAYEDAAVPWMARYGVSKLAVIMSSKALQRKLTSSNKDIICITLHPGFVYTTNHLRFPFHRIIGFFAWLFFKPVDEGAYNSCFAAASPVVRESEDKFKGAYLLPVGKISSPALVALNEDVQNDLWETTERYLKENAL